MGTNSVTNIEGTILGGVTAGIYQRKPWHKHGDVYDANGNLLGRKLKLTANPRTADEIILLADLAWEPREVAISDLDPTLLSDKKILVRDGWPTANQSYDLGVHMESYGTLDNSVGASFVEEILTLRSDARLQNCFQLYGGRIVVAVIEFQDGVKAIRRDGHDHDTVTPYMWVFWSHDGSHALRVVYAKGLAVCENTFNVNATVAGLKVRHTRNAVDHATTALSAVEGMLTAQDEFDKQMQQMIETEITRAQFDDVVKAVLGERPEAEIIVDKNGPKFKDTKGKNWDKQFEEIVSEWNEYTASASAFDAVMAVQGYEQHRQTVRSNREMRAIKKVLNGDYTMTNDAFSAASELLEV